MGKRNTTKQVIPNPTGKGGFADHPESINPGGRPKNQESFSYWMNFFKQLNTKSFLSWEKDNPNHTMAASLAYARVFKSRSDLREFQEVANRTEGMPKQSMELSGPNQGPIEVAEVDAINRIYGDPNRKTSDPGKDSGSTSGATDTP